jgi:hypothetical protein
MYYRTWPCTAEHSYGLSELCIFSSSKRLAYGLKARKYSEDAIVHDVAMRCQLLNFVGVPRIVSDGEYYILDDMGIQCGKGCYSLLMEYGKTPGI